MRTPITGQNAGTPPRPDAPIPPAPIPPAPGRRWQAKHRRMAWLLAGAAVVALAASLALRALDQNLTFFYSPSDIAQTDPGALAGRTIRLGGMVAEHSISRDADGLTVRFIVTDYARETPVSYRGILPDLFREGQGVVAIGKLDAEGRFTAEEILAKHDEKYMPPEVADALKRSGGDTSRLPGAATGGHVTESLITNPGTRP